MATASHALEDAASAGRGKLPVMEAMDAAAAAEPAYIREKQPTQDKNNTTHGLLRVVA
jgi:hypothetical protein